MQLFLDHLESVAVGCAILTFFLTSLFHLFTGQKNNLQDLMPRALAGSCFPISLALLISAFQPQILVQLSNTGLYIALAGLALFYLAVTGGGSSCRKTRLALTKE